MNNIHTLGRKLLGAIIAICTLATVAITTGVASATAYGDDATYTEINGDNTTSIKVDVFADKEHNKPIGPDTTLNIGDSVYGLINIAFKDGTGVPSVDKPDLEYSLPSAIHVTDTTSQVLYDNGTPAGTWSIEGNKVLVHYYKQYLQTHTSNIKLDFAFDFTVASGGLNENNGTTITFPGGAEVNLNFNPPQVNATKAASVNPDGKSVTFTTTFTADYDTDNLAFTDSMQDGLTFQPDSFRFDGSPLTSVTVVNDASPRTATATIGKLTGGKDAQGQPITHTLTYQADLTDAAQTELLAGKTPNLTNTIDYTWDKSSKGQATATPAIDFKGITKKFVTYDDQNHQATWTIKLNSGTYKTNLAGYTVTDQLKAATKIDPTDEDPGESPAQSYSGQYVVKDSKGDVVGSGTLNKADDKFSYTFPTGKVYDDEYTVEYSTTLDNPNVQRQYNNHATLTKGNSSYPPRRCLVPAERQLQRHLQGHTHTECRWNDHLDGYPQWRCLQKRFR